MNEKLKFVGLVAGAMICAYAGVALAQSYAVPSVLGVDSMRDLIQVLPNGDKGVGNQYAKAAQVSGVAGYSNGGAASTAFTHTFAAGEMYFFIQPSGTLGTGTLTAEPNPGDGQRECFFSTQTQTALTWTANTGQTMDTSVPSAGVQNTLQCILFDKPLATWFRVM